MPSQNLFADHIATLQKNYQSALSHCEDLQKNSILIHSGSEHFYFHDDRAIAFQAFGHFLHWLPVNSPDQFLLFSPGQRPRYIQVIPTDFWHDQNIVNESWWAESFDIIRLAKVEELTTHIQASDTIYLGEETNFAQSLLGAELLCNPDSLLHFIDYKRAYKSDYELEQLREANVKGLIGHNAARQAFQEGCNEYQIHQAYLGACGILENEAPYTNIIALDEKSAILHYQNKRQGDASNSQVLLIDAGYRVNGYGSDITRTYAKPTAHPLFLELLQGMEHLEAELVAAVVPGKNYTEIHDLTLSKIGDLLNNLGIVTASSSTMQENRIPQLFMPHGVGHLLGIQVHDVAGFQQDVKGTRVPAPEHSPALRNTRTIEQNMVFTIEPGCYFIPMILEPLRATEIGKLLNWELIDALYPFGGIRIEDNIRVTETGAENLTRNPQH
ncbi:MAG: Xaa-Pro dipeptidase [Pseudohongiellaceae bacterium]